MEKRMRLFFRVDGDWLEVVDEDSHSVLIATNISGTDRDHLANLVGDILRHHFFVWCP